MQQTKPSTLWTLSAALVGTAIGMAAREATARTWEAAREEPAPSNPADRDVSWADALMWAGISGVIVGISRVVAKRGVAEIWASHSDHSSAKWDDGDKA